MAAGAVAAALIGGIGAGGGGAAATAASLFLRGLSHLGQRMPCVIAAPHMKHFWAIHRAPDRRSYAAGPGAAT
jgi:hypothetical protein